MTVVLIVAAVVVVIVVVVLLARRRRPDPVDSFRRQIDALSPEARRPTIDQVKAADDDQGDVEQGAGDRPMETRTVEDYGVDVHGAGDPEPAAGTDLGRHPAPGAEDVDAHVDADADADAGSAPSIDPDREDGGTGPR